MNSITQEKLSTFKDRNLILSQQEFERIFKGTEMGLLKLDQLIEFMQYVIGGEQFDLTNLRWVKGKGERFLKATLDCDHGYVKRDIYLNDDTCYPAAYVDKWQAFRLEKLEQAQPLEDNTQKVFTLDGAGASLNTNPIEVF